MSNLDATTLTLVRHGQTHDNAAGRWQGLRDSPLTAEGRAQAQAAGARLQSLGPYNMVYSSLLPRAMETARLIAATLGEVVRTEPGLEEYDFGEWDGLTPAELLARGFWEKVRQDPEFAPPGGEAFSGAARRVAAALRTIAARHHGERVVIVGHGLTLAAALAQLLDGDSRQAPRYALANGGIADLAMNGQPQLRQLDPTIT